MSNALQFCFRFFPSNSTRRAVGDKARAVRKRSRAYLCLGAGKDKHGARRRGGELGHAVLADASPAARCELGKGNAELSAGSWAAARQLPCGHARCFPSVTCPLCHPHGERVCWRWFICSAFVLTPSTQRGVGRSRWGRMGRCGSAAALGAMWGRLWFGARTAYKEGGWHGGEGCCPWGNGRLKAGEDMLKRIHGMASKMRKGLGASPVMRLGELAPSKEYGARLLSVMPSARAGGSRHSLDVPSEHLEEPLWCCAAGGGALAQVTQRLCRFLGDVGPPALAVPAGAGVRPRVPIHLSHSVWKGMPCPLTLFSALSFSVIVPGLFFFFPNSQPGRIQWKRLHQDN